MNTKFEEYTKARNYFEHIYDLIEPLDPEKPKYKRFSNLHEDKIIFEDEEFDISQNSLKFICDSYETVFEILTK